MTTETTKEVTTQLPSQNSTALKRMQEGTVATILGRVKTMQEAGELVLPHDYEAGNALKSAWLYLQTIETRTRQKAIDTCTQESICNCLLEMCLRGEHPNKHCYFIPCGNRLEYWEKYTGKLMRAKRDTYVADVHPQVIYDNDEFTYTVDEEGNYQLVSHKTSLENMDTAKIKGAYAVVLHKDGKKHLEIMTIDMIRKAWGQGAAKGTSPAHQNFTDQMAKKTIIARACKVALDATEDGYNSTTDDDDRITPPNQAERERDAANDYQPIKAIEHHDDIEDAVVYTETDEQPHPEPQAEPQAEPLELKHEQTAPTTVRKRRVSPF